jgi:cell division protein FtsL
VAAAAQARRAAAAPRREEQPERAATRVPTGPATRRAPQARRRAAQRARLTRLFVIFVVCLTVLAVGRVALSFAVVQKTLQTETVVREQRALSAQNAQLEEKLAQMSSTVRISHIAKTQLGLVEADGWLTLRVAKGAYLAKVAQRP